jgi:hypothetical protein
VISRNIKLAWFCLALQWVLVLVGLNFPETKHMLQPWWEVAWWGLLFGALSFLFSEFKRIPSAKKKHEFKLHEKAKGDPFHKFKCVHCGEVVEAPLWVLEKLPAKLAECNQGAKTTWKERLSGFYNCSVEDGEIDPAPVERIIESQRDFF